MIPESCSQATAIDSSRVPAKLYPLINLSEYKYPQMVIDLLKLILIFLGMEHNILHLPNCSLILTSEVRGHPSIS